MLTLVQVSLVNTDANIGPSFVGQSPKIEVRIYPNGIFDPLCVMVEGGWVRWMGSVAVVAVALGLERSWKIYGKYMENTWEIHGKYMEKSCFYHFRKKEHFQETWAPMFLRKKRPCGDAASWST